MHPHCGSLWGLLLNLKHLSSPLSYLGLFLIGELIYNAASLSDSATCTSSSRKSLIFDCKQAIDDDDSTSWAMGTGDANPWINVSSFRFLLFVNFLICKLRVPILPFPQEYCWFSVGRWCLS